METCGLLISLCVFGVLPIMLLALASWGSGVLDANPLPPDYGGYGYDGYDGGAEDMGGWVLMDEEDFGDWW